MFFFLLLILLGIHSGLSDVGAQDQQPAKPRITHVTVDTATNNTIVFWEESTSPEVERYFIYLQQYDDINPQPGFVIIDSINAPASQYTHINPFGQPLKRLYAVAAENNSGIKSEIKPGIHGTILTSAEHKPCDGSMKLSWNSYIGWDNMVAGYRIHVSRNGSGFSLLTGLTQKDSVFYHYGIEENTSYAYLVEAININGLRSLSNIENRYTYMPGAPELITAEYASVISQNLVELSFLIADTSVLENYALLRSGDKTADFIPIKYTSFTGSGRLVFTDKVITGRESFYYKLGAVNSCDVVIKESNLAINILLTGSENNDRVNLSWNPYEEFIQGVDHYIIYFKTQEGNYIERARTSENTLSFEDDISDLSWQFSSGEITYMVEAIERGTANKAVSNEIHLELGSAIFVPNAFTPNDDGSNDVFQPIFNYLPEDYKLVIFDRQGIRIFVSEIPENGWDGTFQGRKATEGVYLYHIEYKSFNGIRKILTGNVTLFYPNW